MDTPIKAGFGMMLLAIFCTPAYFFIRGKVGVGLVHTCIYGVALLTLVFGIGFFFWWSGVIHASWDLAHLRQEQVIQRQASVIAQKITLSRSLSESRETPSV